MNHSKASRLTEVFVCDLAAKRFGTNQYLPAELRLAEQYQVSRNTIRRMIDNLISDGTLLRDKNHRVRPNPTQMTGNAIPENRQLTFAWAYAAYPDPMISSVTTGIQEYMTSQRLNLQFITSRESHESVLEALKQAPGLGIDGVLVLSYRQERYDQMIDQLLDSGIPVVTIGSPGKSRASSLSGDDFGGVYTALSRMIEEYDRPVYFIATPSTPNDLKYNDRYQAYCQAMRNAGFEESISDHTCLICNGDAPKYWPMNQKLFRAAYQFAPHLNHMKFPASVFCVDDYTANRLYRAAHDAGLQIGSDLMVVGFDDLPFARRLTPPLATIRVDSRKLGFLAAKLLHRAVINSFSSPVHMKVPAEFIERKSLYISKEGS